MARMVTITPEQKTKARVNLKRCLRRSRASVPTGPGEHRASPQGVPGLGDSAVNEQTSGCGRQPAAGCADTRPSAGPSPPRRVADFPSKTGAGRVLPVQSAVVAKMGEKRLSEHTIVDLVCRAYRSALDHGDLLDLAHRDNRAEPAQLHTYPNHQSLTSAIPPLLSSRRLPRYAADFFF